MTMREVIVCVYLFFCAGRQNANKRQWNEDEPLRRGDDSMWNQYSTQRTRSHTMSNTLKFRMHISRSKLKMTFYCSSACIALLLIASSHWHTIHSVHAFGFDGTDSQDRESIAMPSSSMSLILLCARSSKYQQQKKRNRNIQKSETKHNSIVSSNSILFCSLSLSLSFFHGFGIVPLLLEQIVSAIRFLFSVCVAAVAIALTEWIWMSDGSQ